MRKVKRSLCLLLLGSAALLSTLNANAQSKTAYSAFGRDDDTDAGIVTTADGIVHVFTKSNLNLNLLHTWGDARGQQTWQAENLGGKVGSSSDPTKPAAVSWGAGHAAVFLRGNDKQLWYLQWINGVGSGWQPLGGTIKAAPYAISRGPGQLTAFVLWEDNSIRYREWNGSTWSAWQNLGGYKTASPVAVSWGPDHMGVLGRGRDGDLWYKGWSPSAGWNSSWQSLGGRLEGTPTVVSRGPGLIDVFVRGGNNAVWRVGFNGSSWGWYSLGGFTKYEPSAVVTTSGELVAYVRGAEVKLDSVTGYVSRLYINRSSDGGTTWSGWGQIGYPERSGSRSTPEMAPNIYGGWNVATLDYNSGAAGDQLRVENFFYW